MLNLNDYIIQEMNARGIKEFKYVPEYVDIYKRNTHINLADNIYLFVSKDIDTVTPTRVELISHDNNYNFTRTALQTSEISQLQFFSQELDINVTQIDNQTSNALTMKTHVGNNAEFIPFRLEFLRIIPQLDD